MFKSSGSELLTLTALEKELAHRSTPRASQLLKNVRRILSLPQYAASAVKPTLFDPPANSDVTAQPPHTTAPTGPPFFFREPDSLPRPVPVTLPPPATPRTIHRSEPIPFPPPVGPVSNRRTCTVTSSVEACKVLRVAPGADWELIEKARREIVQKSQPDKVRDLAPEKRKALIEHAHRVNEASRVLLELRIQATSQGSDPQEDIKEVPAEAPMMRSQLPA